MTSSTERYQVLDRIGSGGLGVVNRVRDRGSGAIYAMKVMPRAHGAANLRSEFLALARLKHDNIVSVIDYGLTDSGHDFFTMEYVEGPSLLEAVSEVPSPLFYRLIGGMLRALALVHARGMVHADIKPSNVLVDARLLQESPERAARLADFGLAAAIDDPASQAARGTFPYAAPEVYAGRLDARSDLYALGIVLYQMLTGELPYRGSSVREVLAAQRRGPPEDPCTHVKTLPRPLAELVVALCDPMPGARPQTADEVLARINELAGTHFAIADTRPLIDLGGVLVGRERDLSTLQRAWTEIRNGQGQCALLIGEEGIGKSRLMAELKLYVQLDGGQVFSTEVATRRETPYAGIAMLVRGLLASIGGSSRELHPEWQTALAPLLGGRSDAPPIDRASRFSLAEAVTGVVLQVGATHPVLITVDDAHLADSATAELLAYLARSVIDSAVLLVMAARDQAHGNPADSAARLYAAVDDSEHGQLMHLPPIDRLSVVRLASQAFDDDIGDALADDLYRASGGNPSHATRALELLVGSGEVARERGRWILRHRKPTIPVPSDALAAAHARAQALPPAARRALEVAAVLGDSFDRDTAAALLGGADDDADAALAEAARAHVLAGDAATGAFRFAQHGLASVLYDELDVEQRLELHRRAAAVLEARGPAARVEVAAQLARHYQAIGDDERSVSYGLAAAKGHAQSYDHYGSLQWYQRVRPQIHDSAEAALVDERLGDLQSLIGDTDDACTSYERALATTQLPAARVRVALRLGELQRRRGEGDTALATLMAALGEARAHRLVTEEARCHLRIGWVLMYRADYKAAMEHTVAGLVIAQSTGDRETAAELGRLRAAVDIYQGDTRAALEQLDVALAHAEAVGDELLTAGVLHETGRAAIHAGDYARAIEALEKAIAVVERLGHIEQAARSLNNLGAACYFQGDWERARVSWERFRRLCERQGEQSELVNALNNLGSLYRDLGQHGDALASFERAARVADKTGHAHMAAMILGNRGETLFRMGELSQARDCFESAMQRFEHIGAREDTIETRRRMCELDIAAGRIEVALDAAIDAAREAKDAGTRLEEGILHRVVAHALRLQGDRDSAAWFIDRARELISSLGARYEGAKVDMEAAEIAAARGDLDAATQTIAVAIEAFAALGARWDLTAARARQRALGASLGAISSVRSARSARGLRRRGLDLLLELTQAVANVEVERLLEIALDKILALTRFERGFVLLLDDSGRPRERLRRLRPGARGFARDEAEFSGTIVRRVAGSGEAVSVADIADEDELREQKSVVALGLRQIMCAPLRAHGRIIGIIYIDSRRLAFEEHDVDLTLLEAFAAQVALAIENSRLLVEEKRKSELVAILAHEIRNPLAGILGYADIGQSDEEMRALGMEAEELFTRIRRDAERLRRLVDNVLELSRHETGNVEWSLAPFDMAELLRDVVDTYRPVCEHKRIDIRADTSRLATTALGNPDRIAQVLSNILNNAVKFTPTDGAIAISVRTERLSEDDPDAPLPLARGDAAWSPLVVDSDVTRLYVRVDVRDNGPGMSEDIRARLFEKYAQGAGEQRSSGIGLGLYISREIVTRHGGTIWVTSELGKGATFSFRIPAA